MANPPGKCIFCGCGGLSKEHVWPDWMRNHIPRLSSRTKHAVSMNDGPESAGRMNRPGASGSQTLRVVCSKCNNEWMSELQTDAKPILVKLINDEWDSLTPSERETLNRWAVMFTIVVEQAHPSTAAISFEERNAFFSSRVVPEGWHCWIARYRGSRKEPAFWHSGGPPADGDGSGIQMTAFTFGKVTFQTFSCSSRLLYVDIPLEAHAPLMKLYPPRPFIRQRPMMHISDDMVFSIARFLKEGIIAKTGKR